METKADFYRKINYPIYEWKVSAGATGFPSPADDYLENTLNLHDYLQLHPEATFFVQCIGNSMTGDCIHDGDLLIVNRALKATNGSIVICMYQGEHLVKKLLQKHGRMYLVSSHQDYPPIEVRDESELMIWGVVQNVIVNLIPFSKTKTHVRAGRRK